MSIIDKVKELIGSAEVATAAVKPYTGTLPKGVVMKGDTGSDVKALEKFLNWCPKVKAGLPIDGVAGPLVDKAIKKFEKEYGIVQDGVFGSLCKKKAQSIINKYDPTPKPKTVKMGQACGSETGGYSGKAGDQTGKELLICNYSYSASSDSPYHWTAVYRAKDAAARKVIGKACADACKNDYIGYDTSDPDRKSLYKEAKKVKWDIPKIKTKCETTCSELANVCLACAGLKHLGVNKNAYVDSLTAFLNKDDQIKKITSWTKNDLQVGDILRSDCHYAVIVSVK